MQKKTEIREITFEAAEIEVTLVKMIKTIFALPLDLFRHLKQAIR